MSVGRPPSISTVPLRRRVEAGDDVEERALAATRRPDEADEAAGLDRQVETVERDDGVVAAAVDLGDASSRIAGAAVRRRRRPASLRVGQGRHRPSTVGLPAELVSSSLSSVQVVDPGQVDRLEEADRRRRARPSP